MVAVLRGWRLLLASLIAAGGIADAVAGAAQPVPDLLIFQSNLSARTQVLLENVDHVAAIPFDGLVVNNPASWYATLKTTRLSYAYVWGWLEPLVGTLPKLDRSYLLLALRDMGDPFDDGSNVQANWVTMARAARDAGMQGILFDNEAYFEPTMTYPDTVRYPDKGRAAYQRQYQRRGAELVAAMRAEWPEIRIISLHGPYVSEPATPPEVTLEQVGTSRDDMRGFFFSGMWRAQGVPGSIIDGGELYQYRSDADFDRSVQWRRFGIAEVPGSPLVPPRWSLRWQQKLALGFGVYDLQWRPDYPMTPPLLEEAIYQALVHADAPVWLFTEGDHDYLVPGGVDARWMNAVARAKARAHAPPVTGGP
jgi:hypothetical protein